MKDRISKIMKCLVLGLAAIGVIVAVLAYRRYHEDVVVITALSEVTFCDKWVEDGICYVSIHTNQEAPMPLDTYFLEPRTLRMVGGEFYQAVVLEEVSYMSVTLRIEIPYGEAKKLNLLEEGVGSNDIKSICIEKVLENEEYVKAYCTIESIMP